MVAVTRSPWATVCTTDVRWLRTDEALCVVRSRSWLSAFADVLRDEFCQASLSALAKPPPMPSRPPTEPKIPATPRPPPKPPVEELEPPRVDSLRVADTISLMSRSRSRLASMRSTEVRDSSRLVTSRRSQSTTASCFFWPGASGRL